MIDPRIANCLARAEADEGHPRTLYAALAWCFARDAGDVGAMRRAVALGAFLYRRERPIYARTEDAVQVPEQAALWDAQEMTI